MSGKLRFGMRGQGAGALMKDGFKHLSGLEQAILKNIEACKALSDMTRTSMGPNGMNKLVRAGGGSMVKWTQQGHEQAGTRELPLY